MRKIILSLAIGAALPGVAGAANRDIAELYQKNCSVCHAPDLRGGPAESLLDDKWQQGKGDDDSIAKAIREGNAVDGMPPWKGVLSEAEIRGMVIFLREKIAEAQNATNQFPRPTEGQAVKTRLESFRFHTVVEGLETPWSLAALPDGRLLVTELPGRLRIIADGKLLPQAISGTPPVRFKGQGGLMAVAAHPGWRTNGWVYLAYSEAITNAGRELGMTTIVRGRIRANAWVDQETIYRAADEQFLPTAHHYGCRLVFDGQGHLFFAIGERGMMQHAQELARPNGKVHRLRDDGRVPADNPFVGQSNVVASVWSYGNRNPQGLARHPVSGDLWATEHGPRGGDELNVILPGRNYGWPLVTHGMNYDGKPITELTEREGIEPSVVHWTPSLAVGAIDFYTGNRFPAWRGDLLLTSLAAQELRRLRIEGRKVVEQEVLFKNVGRVREVLCAPDGYIYLALNKPDLVVRLEPAP